MIEIQAPHPDPEGQSLKARIFLAGSIEMGKAEPWQSKILTALSDLSDEYWFYNPRRDDWDSSWEQSKNNPQFYEQVHWELTSLNRADLVVFYFDPGTYSPITLLELGSCKGSEADVIVCCPEGYWRKGNVDIFCDTYGINQVDTLDELIENVRSYCEF